MKNIFKIILRQPTLVFGLLSICLVIAGLAVVLLLSQKSSENRSKATTDQFTGRVYFVPTEQDNVQSTLDTLELIPSADGIQSLVGRADIKIDVNEPIIATDLTLIVGPENLDKIEVVSFIPNSGLFTGISKVAPVQSNGRVPIGSDGRLRLLVASNKTITVAGTARNLGNIQIKFKGALPASLASLNSLIRVESAKVVVPERVYTVVNPSGSTSLDGKYRGTLALKYIKPAQANSLLGTCQCANSAVVESANRCVTNAKAICIGANACGCAQAVSCQELKMTDISNPPRIITAISPNQTVGFKFVANTSGQSPSTQWDARIKLAQITGAGIGDYMQFGSNRFNPFNPSPMFQELPFGINSWTGVSSVTYLMNLRHPMTVTENGTNNETYLWCNPSGGGEWQITDNAGQPLSQYSTAGFTNTNTRCNNLCVGGVTVVTPSPQTSPTPTVIPLSTLTPTPTSITCPVCKTYQPGTGTCENVAGDTRCNTRTGACSDGQCVPDPSSTPTPTPSQSMPTSTPTLVPTRVISKNPTAAPSIIPDS